MKLPVKVVTIRVVDHVALSKAIGRKFRAVRQQRGETQAHAAQMLGMTRVNYANIEAGRQRILLEHIYTASAHWRVAIQRLLP